jgi:hypothetical protein
MSDVLGERKTFLANMAKQLRLLEHDLLFEQAGGKPSYVVDFAVIYAFARKGPAAGRLKLSSESDERVYSRRQVALGYVFSGRIKQLLLSDHIMPNCEIIFSQLPYMLQ